MEAIDPTLPRLYPGEVFCITRGFYEFASGVVCFCPGILMIEKCYDRVFFSAHSTSLFLMSPRCQMLRTPSSNLCSVATTKCSNRVRMWTPIHKPEPMLPLQLVQILILLDVWPCYPRTLFSTLLSSR